MEIVIGSAVPFKNVGLEKERKNRQGKIVEAKLVSSRSPRRQVGKVDGKFNERRGSNDLVDPAGSRILTLMVSEGSAVPKDFDLESHRIFLRFAVK